MPPAGQRGNVCAVSDRELLEEQLAYYRARAGEYDEWWERLGKYDRGEEENQQWANEIGVLLGLFDSLPLDGDIVELAPGTGYWTHLLAERANSLTAVDGAPEMIACNRTRLGAKAGAVTYVQHDIFEWVPPRRFDGMVFCFWISHVPRSRLTEFFATCHSALHDGACVFFVDLRFDPTGFAVEEIRFEEDPELTLRRLNDGREFTIIKNYYDTGELQAAAAAAGIRLEVGYTSKFFQYGIGYAS